MQHSFRALIESAPDAMMIVDAEHNIVLVNAQTERLFGYRREELLGQPIETLVPERFQGRRVAHRSGYSADPHVRPMGVGLELYGRCKEGSEFPTEISLSPLDTEDGTLVSSAIRDITDRKRAEEDAAHFRSVIESSQDAIIGKDLDGVITSWNKSAERLYGYSAAEAIGKSISMLVPPGQDDELPELLRRVRSGEQIDNYETVRARKDGTLVDVSLTVSAIRDQRGSVIGVSSIARGITDRKQAEQSLRQAQRMETVGQIAGGPWDRALGRRRRGSARRDHPYPHGRGLPRARSPERARGHQGLRDDAGRHIGDRRDHAGRGVGEGPRRPPAPG